MSTRPQQRAPKGHYRDRTDRRAVVDVLLSRARRGVLCPAEAALLSEHVREEQRLADESRRAMAGTTQTLERHREAADAAIVEAEQRAEAAEKQLAPVEAAVAEVRRLYRVAGIDLDQVRAVLARVRNAETLGHVLAAVAEHDGLSPTLAHIHARILDRADSTDARLAEQHRGHDIALATERRRTEGWKEHAREAERQAGRYRIAWVAARRDRYADRVAMAAELPLAQAVDRVRALAARMRAGSPQGTAAIYADRIEQALADEHQEQR
ncbi:hypothetical protein [Streptomyces sp. NPDC048436]|uniref:hypothetical protein n=1 Tax=Streptomyces sp. NPDC048436 TaxID=3365550 RepID=UPI00371BC5B5